MGRLKTLGSRVTLLDTRIATPPAKTGDPFYDTPEWRALMAKLIKERGRRCEDVKCQATHRPGQMIYGDHIVELQDGGAPLDPANVMLRCASSHKIKTNQERAKRLAAPLKR